MLKNVKVLKRSTYELLNVKLKRMNSKVKKKMKNEMSMYYLMLNYSQC